MLVSGNRWVPSNSKFKSWKPKTNNSNHRGQLRSSQNNKLIREKKCNDCRRVLLPWRGRMNNWKWAWVHSKTNSNKLIDWSSSCPHADRNYSTSMIFWRRNKSIKIKSNSISSMKGKSIHQPKQQSITMSIQSITNLLKSRTWKNSSTWLTGKSTNSINRWETKSQPSRTTSTQSSNSNTIILNCIANTTNSTPGGLTSLND